MGAMLFEEVKEKISDLPETPHNQRSVLWKSLRNFRKNTDFESFLSRDSTAAVGLGLPRRLSRPEYDELFARWLERFQLGGTDLARFPEPTIGNPTQCTVGEEKASVPYLKKLSRFNLVADLVRSHSHHDKGLRFLEVGAGYGGVAELLLRTGIAKSYTIIDLPEVLALSASYLSQCHPGRSIGIGHPAELSFWTPPMKEVIEGPFDVVLNSSSFGEMPTVIVNDYLRWIPSVLASRGILISHNSVGRTKGGPSRYSDYDFEFFKLAGLYPQRYPSGPLNDQHLIVVLEHGDGIDVSGLDIFGAMVHVGLHEDVRTCMGKFIRGDCSPRQLWSEQTSYIGRYIRAGSRFRRQNLMAFEEYLSIGQSPIAMAYSKRLLGVNHPHVPEYLSVQHESEKRIIGRFVRSRFIAGHGSTTELAFHRLTPRSQFVSSGS